MKKTAQFCVLVCILLLAFTQPSLAWSLPYSVTPIYVACLRCLLPVVLAGLLVYVIVKQNNSVKSNTPKRHSLASQIAAQSKTKSRKSKPKIKIKQRK